MYSRCRHEHDFILHTHVFTPHYSMCPLENNTSTFLQLYNNSYNYFIQQLCWVCIWHIYNDVASVHLFRHLFVDCPPHIKLWLITTEAATGAPCCRPHTSARIKCSVSLPSVSAVELLKFYYLHLTNSIFLINKWTR